MTELLRNNSVRIITKHEGEDYEEEDIHGTGTLYQPSTNEIFLITARHCLLDELDDRKDVPIKQISVFRSPIISLKEKVIQPEAEQILHSEAYDLSIVRIQIEENCDFFDGVSDWSIVNELSNSNSLIEFTSLGYSVKRDRNGKTFQWKFQEETRIVDNEGPCFSLQANQGFAAAGNTSRAYLKGYSGAGAFLQSTNLLSCIIVSVVEGEELNREVWGLEASVINELLEQKNLPLIPEDKYQRFTPRQKEAPENYFPRKIVSEKDIKEKASGLFFGLASEGKIQKTLLEVIQVKEKIVLLGEGGLGKSYEMQYLMSQLGKEKDPALFPFFLSLDTYSGQSIPEILDEKYPDWKEVRKQHVLVLILDAYEESGGKERLDLFNRSLVGFISDEKPPKVVISIRNEHYNSHLWKGFEPYHLEKLSRTDIQKIAEQQLPQNWRRFIEQLSTKGLYSLAGIPFYLWNLFKIFKNSPSQELPKSKMGIIDQLIAERRKTDEEKYRQDPRDILSTGLEYSALERLAFFMTQKNIFSVPNETLRAIVPPNLYDMVMDHPVAKLTIKDGFKFVHTIFQEYFTAKKILNQSFVDWMDTIIWGTELQELKPQYRPLVNYLLSEMDENDDRKSLFTAWLGEHELSFIIEIDPMGIPADTRHQFFKEIFNSLISGNSFGINIWRLDKLRKFGSSEQTNQFLISQIEQTGQELEVMNWAFWLLSIEVATGGRQKVKKFLRNNLKGGQHQYQSAMALERMEALRVEEAKGLIDHFIGSDFLSEKDLAFRLIINHSLADDYSKLLIEIIHKYAQKQQEVYDQINSSTDPNAKWQMDSNVELPGLFKEAIFTIQEPDNLLSLLDALNSAEVLIPKLFEFSSIEDVLNTFPEALLKAYKIYPSVYEKVKELYLTLSQKLDGVTRDLGKFFKESETDVRFFNDLLKSGRFNIIEEHAIASIGGERIQKQCIKVFNEGGITGFALEQIVKEFRPEEIDDFKDKIETETQYYSKKEEKNKDRVKKSVGYIKEQINLLFDKHLFLAKVLIIFDNWGKEKLTPGDRSSFNSKFNAYDYPAANAALTFMGDYFSQRHGPVDKRGLIISFEKRYPILILELISKNYSRNSEVILSFKDRINEIIKTEIKRLVTPSDRKDGIFPSLVNFFFQIECISIPELDLLNLTLHYLNDTGNLFGKVWKKIQIKAGKEKFEEKIFENLQRKDLTVSVFVTQLKYCREFDFSDTLPLIIENLKKQKWDYLLNDYTAQEIIHALDALSHSDDSALESLLVFQDLHLSVLPFVIEALVKRRNARCFDYLKEKFRLGHKESSAKHLIKYGDADALDFYVGYIRKGQEVPYGIKIFSYLKDLKTMPLVIEAIDHLWTLNREWTSNPFKGIVSIASQPKQFDETEILVKEYLELKKSDGTRVDYESLQRPLLQSLKEAKRHIYSGKEYENPDLAWDDF